MINAPEFDGIKCNIDQTITDYRLQILVFKDLTRSCKLQIPAKLSF